MTRVDKLYWRSEAGVRAWRCPDSGLPEPFRRILGAMQAPVALGALRKALTATSDRDLTALLEQLETLGFVETAPAAYQLKAA